MAYITDKFSTLVGDRVGSSAQVVAQHLMAKEIGAALHRSGPWIERAAERVPLKVDAVRINGQFDYATQRRQFRVEVSLSIDEADLQDLQRY